MDGIDCCRIHQNPTSPVTAFTGTYRLVTTLTDARRYPAAALVRLYHQRWEHESAYYALRHTMMQGRIRAVASGGHAHSEDDIRYVRRRYLTPQIAADIAIAIANATFTTRDVELWGEGTTGPAPEVWTP